MTATVALLVALLVLFRAFSTILVRMGNEPG